MAECKKGCGRVARSRGMCSSHYRRWNAGKPLDTPIRGYRKYPEIGRRARRELSFSFHPALGCAVSPARASVRPRTRTAPLFRLALGRCASYAKGKGWHGWHSGAYSHPAASV
jgi:hypothetical protein